MKFRLLGCLLFILPLWTGIAIAQSGWYRLETGIARTIYGLAFTSENTGYVVGDSGTAFRTTDGGLSWRPMTVPVAQRNWPLSKIKFATESIGLILDEQNHGTYFLSLLYRTGDAGDTWLPVPVSDFEGMLMDIDFPSSRVGYLAGGRFELDSGVVLKSVDGGTTWANVYHNRGYLAREVAFRDEQNGLVIMGGGEPVTFHLLRTSDGGGTWNVISPCGGDCPEMFGLEHIGAQTWVVAVGPAIMRTTNDGATWTSSDRLPGLLWERIRDISFFNDQIGYAASESMRYIFKSTNGGIDWHAQQSNADAWLFQVDAPGMGVAYALGDSSRIIKTVDGGGALSSVPVARNQTGTLAADVLSSDEVRFTFGSDASARRLELRGLRGNLVREEYVLPGDVSVLSNIGDLPSGIYWCRLGGEQVKFAVCR